MNKNRHRAIYYVTLREVSTEKQYNMYKSRERLCPGPRGETIPGPAIPKEPDILVVLPVSLLAE